MSTHILTHSAVLGVVRHHLCAADGRLEGAAPPALRHSLYLWLIQLINTLGRASQDKLATHTCHTKTTTTNLSNITSSWAIEPRSSQIAWQRCAYSGTSNLRCKSVPPQRDASKPLFHIGSPLYNALRARRLPAPRLYTFDWMRVPMPCQCYDHIFVVVSKMTYRKGVTYVKESTKCT